MNLRDLYLDVLYEVGLAATFSGFFAEAAAIQKFGNAVDSNLQTQLIAFVQNEALQGNYASALAAIDAWEKEGNKPSSYILWWKAIVAGLLGSFHVSQNCIYRIRYECASSEVADGLEKDLDLLESF
jgi:hypothetical protein